MSGAGTRALDLVTVGDPTIDTFLRIHDAHVALSLDPDRPQLCIDYAQKIPVDAYFRSPGGNCANGAVGASRLGLRTAVWGVVGDDLEGRWLRRELVSEGVEVTHLATDDSAPTNASTVILFRGERTIFSWHQARHYPRRDLPRSAWIYLTSIGPAGPETASLQERICAQAARTGARLAFNPGSHQLRMGLAALRPILARTEVLLLNRQEAQVLLSTGASDLADLAARLRRLGPRIVAITDGPQGSYATDGEHAGHCPIADVPVVDRTGAGDAYGSGFLAALHHGAGVPEAMRWGTLNAGGTVREVGAVSGLLTRAEMETALAGRPLAAAVPA